MLADRQTNAFQLCVNFMHFVRRTHKFLCSVRQVKVSCLPKVSNNRLAPREGSRYPLEVEAGWASEKRNNVFSVEQAGGGGVAQPLSYPLYRLICYGSR